MAGERGLRMPIRPDRPLRPGGCDHHRHQDAEVSGLELIRQIRERTRDPYRDPQMTQQFAYAKAIELGVTRHLLKPTNPRELIAVLEE